MMNVVSENIRNLRHEKGWSQEQLAQKLSCERTTVANWETGRNNPPIESLKELSKVFDVKIDNLLLGSKEEMKKGKTDHFPDLTDKYTGYARVEFDYADELQSEYVDLLISRSDASLIGIEMREGTVEIGNDYDIFDQIIQVLSVKYPAIDDEVELFLLHDNDSIQEIIDNFEKEERLIKNVSKAMIAAMYDFYTEVNSTPYFSISVNKPITEIRSVLKRTLNAVFPEKRECVEEYLGYEMVDDYHSFIETNQINEYDTDEIKNEIYNKFCSEKDFTRRAKGLEKVLKNRYEYEAKEDGGIFILPNNLTFKYSPSVPMEEVIIRALIKHESRGPIFSLVYCYRIDQNEDLEGLADRIVHDVEVYCEARNPMNALKDSVEYEL